MPQQERINDWVASLDERQFAEAVTLFAPPTTPTAATTAQALRTALGDLLAALDALPPGRLTGPELIAVATARTRALLNDKDAAA
ncbi:hypothetical protein DVS28_b0069 (plasmid) [Euzebya pacifica]|uniref:Uncharacterized protein n=1 Tax=Euzebya pacifica TaxID=1608957 RepID=A0A346Y5U2_9ACTN|nr:hypothetical protein [Euzebya pacifica]AXV09839.1 hypothetical protein DVS28_b0069 [Euzebya pacifica]